MLQFLSKDFVLKQCVHFTHRKGLFDVLKNCSPRSEALHPIFHRQNASRSHSRKMSSLDSVADVSIDSSEKFKYILIKIWPTDDETNSKYIVRGYGWADYHADIFAEVERKLTSKQISCDCKGGGRIKHYPEAKTISVYGYSMGFGRADHSITVEKLKAEFPDYTSITFSNEGY